MKKPTAAPAPEAIAIVDAFDQLKPDTRYLSRSAEIRVTIGAVHRADNGNESPRNWSHWDRESKTGPCGGCSARMYASEASYYTGTEGNHLLTNGPQVTSDDVRDYEYAVKALKLIAKRHSEQYATRGNPVDAAESMGRWLEACGVKRVFMRPSPVCASSWLSEGEWLILSVGTFVGKVRSALYVVPASPAGSETVSATA